jgi:hypothetical protein
MGFYLPGIYKPFYIEGLLVHSQAEYREGFDYNFRNDILFSLIDVHNGIGIYDTGKKVYKVGDVSCTFNFYNGQTTKTHEKTITVYREKPLFASSYQETISSVFDKVDVTGTFLHYYPSSISVTYISPYAYGIYANRNIYLTFNVSKDDGIYDRTTGSYEPLHMKQHSEGGNKWIIDYEDLDNTFIECVSGATSKNVAYYVVNEAFYKYFIKPETHIPGEASLFYRTYNNGENTAFQGDDGDRVRNFCDLFPYKIRYNGDSTTNNFDFDERDYDTSKNCCYTKPFLRMFPALNNKLNNNPNTDQPGSCRIVYEGPSIYGGEGTIKFEGDNQFIMSNEDETELDDVNFYLICVKSPLTSNRILSNANSYESAMEGKFLNPEQDYITYIRNYGRIIMRPNYDE